MKKENFDEPIYENLELYSGLELVYRHPCLHFRVDSHECSNCKYGKINKCRIDEEYQKISKDLKDYEKLKNLMETPIQDIMKLLKILEILKGMLTIEKGSTWWYLDTKHCFFENEEDRKKIEEWLD